MLIVWNGCTDRKRLENKLIDFFTKDRQRQLTKIKEKFNNKEELKQFKEIYSQAYYNYNNKYYYSSGIALTAIYEGLIRTYTNILPNESKKNVKELNGKLDKKYKNKYSIIFQDKIGIIQFNEKFFSKIKDCNINNDNYFNRNVLMHGLNFENFKKVDALKLFNAIDILNNLMIDDYEV